MHATLDASAAHYVSRTAVHTSHVHTMTQYKGRINREVPEYDFSCQNPWRLYRFFIRRFRAVKSSGVRNLCVCRHCLGYDRKHVTFPRYAFLFWKFVPKSKLPAKNRCFSYQICTRKIFLHPMTQNLHTKHGSYESQSTRILVPKNRMEHAWKKSVAPIRILERKIVLRNL